MVAKIIYKEKTMSVLEFENVTGNIYLLRVPFGDSWTGVTLIKGPENVLIDTGSRGADTDEYIVPALARLGLALSDIGWLVNTHSHGDHIGGYQRIKELCPKLKVAAARSDAANVEDPAALAVRIRTRFPEYSPAPQSYLKGVRVDRVLSDGECLIPDLRVVETPGHDMGCVCWYEEKTRSLITGDSIQGNGTPAQGIGFYQSLDAYRASMKKLLALGAENIICGHDYDMIGSVIKGADKVRKALQLSLDLTDKYQDYVDKKLESGICDAGQIAKSMIEDIGCGMPPALFMAVYTVTGHIEKSEKRC